MVSELAFSGVAIIQKDVPAYLSPFFELSYVKHAFDGLLMTLMGYDRKKLECDQMYCHFQDPKKFLQFIDLDRNYGNIVIFLLVHMILMRFIVWSLLKYRLK
jgi:hypothetical protein